MKKLKLYDFTAPWCAPCRSMGPILKKVATLHPEVEIVKVNVDTEAGEALASRYRIQAVPAFFVASAADDKLTRVRTGTQTVEEITNLINAARGVLGGLKQGGNTTKQTKEA